MGKTKYQIEQRTDSGKWVAMGTPYESMTAAEILCAAAFPDKVTRVVPVVESSPRAPWVPDQLSESVRRAEVEMIKRLAEDLSYDKVNYAANLESIVLRARRLFDDEARLIGRGYKNGENTACQACDGVYVKDKP